MHEVKITEAGDATPPLAPFFVVGPARSGTTVFTHTLARAYALACVPETNLLVVLLKSLAESDDATFAEFEALQHNVMMHGQNRPYSILFAPEMRPRRLRDQPNALFEAILRCDRYSEGDRVIEQTPRNGERLRLLRWMFPDSLIFFMSRNPIDVIESNRRTPWGTRNRLKLILILLRPYFELRELARTYGLGHTMIVEYEKLSDAARNGRCLSRGGGSRCDPTGGRNRHRADQLFCQRLGEGSFPKGGRSVFFRPAASGSPATCSSPHRRACSDASDRSHKDRTFRSAGPTAVRNEFSRKKGASPLTNPSRKIGLIGYFGNENIGDDVMLANMERMIGEGNHVVVHPKDNLLRLFRKLWRCSAIVVCGGAVIRRNNAAYLKVMFAAKLLWVKRIYYSIEISEWPAGRLGRIQKFLMRDASVFVRDLRSYLIAERAIGVGKATLVADLFYLDDAMFKPMAADESRSYGRMVIGPGDGKRKLVVLPRTKFNSADYSEEKNERRLLDAIHRWRAQKTFDKVLLIPSAANDDVRSLSVLFDQEGIDYVITDSDTRIALAAGDVVVTNRLHIFKAVCLHNIDCVLVSYDTKTEWPEVVGERGEIVSLAGENYNIADFRIPMSVMAERIAISKNALMNAILD